MSDDNPQDPRQIARDLPGIDTYSRATQSLRDATKWLVATVTGVGLLVSVGTTLPDSLAIDADDDGRTCAILLSIVAIAAVLVVAWMGSRVLVGPERSWGSTLANRGDGDGGVGGAAGIEKILDDNGVLWPWGYRRAALFFDEHGDVVLGADRASPSSVRIVATVIDFLTYHDTRKRFVCFVTTAAIAITIALACTVAADRIAADREPTPAPTRISIVDDTEP